MSKHIAILNAPFHGHINPTLVVVAELVRRGYRVTYITTPDFTEKVSSVGAAVAHYTSTWPEGKSAPEKVSDDEMAGGPLKFLLENEAAVAGAAPHFVGDEPDLLFYDALMHHAGRALATKWSCPAVQSIPLFASNEHYSLNEALAGEFPSITPEHPKLVEFFTRLTEFRETHNLATGSTGEILDGIEDLNLVFMARSYQPAGETFDERFVFVGPSLIDRSTEEHWEPPQNDNPTLLITLGSVWNARAEFYKKAIAAFADLDWNVVIATGPNVDPADLGPIPANFEVKQRIPSQLAVLEHGQVFVTHSGLGSTMESMYYGTPLVAVPQAAELDLVALRTEELGLGLRIPGDEVTPEALREAVLKVAADQEMQERCRVMQKEVVEGGGAIRVVDEIEAYLARVRG
ncbi:macrolide family glycosyltransferase [Kitasatospora azatica]|uniref:macrolide family glycosyltransferase n=1 Tax=Kitasatospora azatica TaxID=58347 RepID=UPI00068AD401|nr:macrolide family glycosyltransferase [Kitasatospora azatica]